MKVWLATFGCFALVALLALLGYLKTPVPAQPGEKAGVVKGGTVPEPEVAQSTVPDVSDGTSSIPHQGPAARIYQVRTRVILIVLIFVGIGFAIGAYVRWRGSRASRTG